MSDGSYREFDYTYEFWLFNADVNRDGCINVVDATLIRKYVVGLYK